MRLLDTSTLSLKLFISNDKPDYVILSHVWGVDEITFKDFDEEGALKPGTAERRPDSYKKLFGATAQARRDGYDWIWIDTCAIDKSSSSELQEAINSMFQWYRKANICYAFLVDISGKDFTESRWFTRGWTLQELLAPMSVIFYDQHWDEIGTKSSRAEAIRDITRIDLFALRTRYRLVNAAIVFSWAAHRHTSKAEDMAYCLLGLCDISMPMLYGEGRTQAFQRLQTEIMKRHQDSTIFLFTRCVNNFSFPVLALGPDQFCQRDDCQLCVQTGNPCFQLDVPYPLLRPLKFPFQLNMSVLSDAVQCSFPIIGIQKWRWLSMFRHRHFYLRYLMMLNVQTVDDEVVYLQLERCQTISITHNTYQFRRHRGPAVLRKAVYVNPTTFTLRTPETFVDPTTATQFSLTIYHSRKNHQIARWVVSHFLDFFGNHRDILTDEIEGASGSNFSIMLPISAGYSLDEHLVLLNAECDRAPSQQKEQDQDQDQEQHTNGDKDTDQAHNQEQDKAGLTILLRYRCRDEVARIQDVRVGTNYWTAQELELVAEESQAWAESNNDDQTLATDRGDVRIALRRLAGETSDDVHSIRYRLDIS